MAPPRRQFQDLDRGWRRIVAAMRAMGGKQVTVGVHGDDAARQAGHSGGYISNVGLAVVHEFGVDKQTAKGRVYVPERSFLRAGFDANRRKYERLLRQFARRVGERSWSIDRALGTLGEVMQHDVVRTILDGPPPELAESTKRRKGSSKQLQDKGELKNSIKWVVK